MKRLIIILILIAAVLVLFFMPRDEKKQRVAVAVGLKAPDFELPEIGSSGKEGLFLLPTSVVS